MKLSLEQIKSLAVGAVQVWEEADGFHFCKMSKAQIDAYQMLSEMLYNNARATTGIRLDFHTDATILTYQTLTDGKYELKIDGALTRQIQAKAGEPITVSLPADGAAHRVTLHLPSHGIPGGFSYVELSDGATLSRHWFDKKLLIIGDSITQGWNSELDTISYAYQVSDHFNAESIIQGVGGACYEPSTVPEIDFDPDTVIVAYGTNDANKYATLSEIEEKCRAYLQKLLTIYPKEKLRVITPILRMNADEQKAYGCVTLVNDTVAAVATSLGLSFIDGRRMIPPIPGMMADNLHPNGMGFALYAHNLIKELSK